MPTYGNSEAPVAQATSTGSRIRRLASRNVHAIRAIQTTTRKRTSRFTKRLRPSFVIPNRARGMLARTERGKAE